MPETVLIFVKALSLESTSYAVVILKQQEPLQLNSPCFAFDTGTLSTSYDVTLSSAQSSDVTFDYKIAANSTASADDYVLENGTLTIPAGETSASIAVTINSDDLAEGQTDEKLTIVLSNPVNAVLGRDSADIFIYDPDTNRDIYDDYYGTFDAETSTFTISEGIKYNPRYERLDLPAPITFTTTDWTANMYKVWGEGEEWEHIDKRDLNLYYENTSLYFLCARYYFQDFFY